ncbi:cytochrome c oxidase assembly protein [Bacillus massiliglaciei]|uniref:cytochrome c oxidase assembly protein n=1 Tax=Bacillus massiliglaciei TaxID=1816693 RepID=UPI000A71DBD6|nr:cytochrome c oxidase assembly protein [Bacillus massiliglaciei]
MNVYFYHAGETHIHSGSEMLTQLILSGPFALAFVLYFLAAVLSSRKYRPWPIYRTVCWTFGLFLAVLAVAGPVADAAHADFTVHMLGHLLLGMASPLLMVLGAPMTLLMRSLRTSAARKVSMFLRTWPFVLLSNPIIASILNIGGLWLLYTTSLFSLIHTFPLVHLLVHFHVFLAGYLFTMSMIYIDPVHRRFSFLFRSLVLIVALAGHGILSKYIYAHPPDRVPTGQAQTGAMLMYYGGDLIDIALISILCFHWFKASRPRSAAAETSS